ncbi:MAG: DUF3179 domain-containing protein [Methyloligellaceae bacterium]
MSKLSAALLAAILIAGGVAVAMATPQQWRLQGWAKTDFTKTSIKFEEIISGGPPKDGIPSIDKPKFVDVKDETTLGLQEPVVGLAIGGEARAYPLRILTWHEIVNDTVAGTPVTVTYCPLCNSAIVFDRRIDGKVHDFGTTGKLRNSDLVMYDRQTESWWQQFTGEAIVGVYMGRTLKTIPARLESFERFRKRHPQGQVLVPENPQMRPYGRNPYAGYDSSKTPFLYAGEMPKDINPMARVVVVEAEGKQQAVTLKLLRDKGKITVGDVVLSWEAGQNSALDAREIQSGRDVGNVMAQRKSGDGMVDVKYDVTFAFVFHAFYPKEPIRKG